MNADALLIDLKVARLTNHPRHLDSITDIAGYASCLPEVFAMRKLRSRWRNG